MSRPAMTTAVGLLLSLTLAASTAGSANGQHASTTQAEGSGTAAFSTISTGFPPLRQHTSLAEADRVTHLPGWGPITGFDLFAGYITVDATAGRALFYVLAESMRSPSQDPLVLWLNGGPGCSSLGGGFMSELGPFFPREDGRTLQSNPYAWNRVANMVFVETPAFVGFSYSNSSKDKVTGDAVTAADTRAFLLGLLERFPRFKPNDLYLSGESYAGHYVPMLARDIIEGDANAHPSEALRLRGFLVGNPSTDRITDRLGAADFLWSHGLISDETAEDCRSSCTKRPSGGNPDQPACVAAFNRANEEMGNINIYEILADVCLPRQARSEAAAFERALKRAVTASKSHVQRSGSAAVGRNRRLRARAGAAVRSVVGEQQQGQGEEIGRPDVGAATSAGGAASVSEGASSFSSWLAGKWSNGKSEAKASPTGAYGLQDPGPTYDPCVDDEVETYLNLPEVQRALHANQSVVLPYRWTDCSDVVQYRVDDLWEDMVPVYEWLLATTDLRILVYSGDVDGMVPLVGTRRWIAGLGLPVKRKWRPWSSSTSQVAGYSTEYDAGAASLTFSTVRGAGHMVPYVQPERMFHLFTSFLEGQHPGTLL